MQLLFTGEGNVVPHTFACRHAFYFLFAVILKKLAIIRRVPCVIEPLCSDRVQTAHGGVAVATHLILSSTFSDQFDNIERKKIKTLNLGTAGCKKSSQFFPGILFGNLYDDSFSCVSSFACEGCTKNEEGIVFAL